MVKMSCRNETRDEESVAGNENLEAGLEKISNRRNMMMKLHLIHMQMI